MTDHEISRLMKRCQVGFGGRDALEQAHDCLADCYGALGRLAAQRETLCRTLIRMVALYESEQDNTTPQRPEWLTGALLIEHERES